LWYKILYENTELVKSIEIYTQLALCTADWVTYSQSAIQHEEAGDAM
jgi:hypothetical protein